MNLEGRQVEQPTSVFVEPRFGVVSQRTSRLFYPLGDIQEEARKQIDENRKKIEKVPGLESTEQPIGGTVLKIKQNVYTGST